MPRIFISHRGNIRGPDPKMENSPVHITAALAAGYNVEVDVRYIDGVWYLGHDEPVHIVDFDYLNDERIWLHCKNMEALAELNIMMSVKAHYFWHQEDDVALTSNRWLWTYPGKQLMERGAIAVCPEMVDDQWDISNAEGVCSDFVEAWKNGEKGEAPDTRRGHTGEESVGV